MTAGLRVAAAWMVAIPASLMTFCASPAPDPCDPSQAPYCSASGASPSCSPICNAGVWGCSCGESAPVREGCRNASNCPNGQVCCLDFSSNTVAGTCEATPCASGDQQCAVASECSPGEACAAPRVLGLPDLSTGFKVCSKQRDAGPESGTESGGSVAEGGVLAYDAHPQVEAALDVFVDGPEADSGAEASASAGEGGAEASTD